MRDGEESKRRGDSKKQPALFWPRPGSALSEPCLRFFKPLSRSTLSSLPPTFALFQPCFPPFREGRQAIQLT
mgnify:CR=1 FL=1